MAASPESIVLASVIMDSGLAADAAIRNDGAAVLSRARAAPTASVGCRDAALAAQALDLFTIVDSIADPANQRNRLSEPAE